MSFGRFREIALLGYGGMARVVLASLPSAAGVQKLVVIKELLPELAADPEFIAMFTDEARLATRLDHPNLVQTYELGQEAGRYFFVMEYLDGQSLSALLNRTKREVSLRVLLHVFTRVLAGLHHAHELVDLAGKPLGIVHRDVSPQNVFLSYGGAIKLVDFGIAKVVGAQAKTRTGVFKGKLGYASPEQIANEGVDRRTDVFAVGVLLWEALAGKKITNDVSEPALLHQRINGLDPKIREVAPDAPTELAEICDRAMATARDGRFASAADMQRAIEVYMDHAGMRATDAEVGALVASVFETERSQVRKLIQERLAAPDSSVVPLLATPPSSTSSVNTGGGVPGEQPTAVSVSMGTAAPGPKRRPGVAVWAALGAVVLAAVAGVALTRHHGAPPDAANPAPSVTASAPIATPPRPSAEPEPALVDVSFAAAPPAARFTLDGAPLGENPFTARRARDGKPHVLRATAPGFVPEERIIVLDRDVRLELALRAEPAPSRARPAAPHDDPTLPRGPRPTKPIDTADPWGSK